MKTVPNTYRTSPEVDKELKKRAELEGSVEKVLRGLLFSAERDREILEGKRIEAARALKPGDYALLNELRCQVLEREGLGYLRVFLIQQSVVVSASAKDLIKVADIEAVGWKLTP